MKKLSALLLTIASATIAYAAPLREADLGADAKWFAHMDVEAVRAAPAGQQFLAERTGSACNPFAKLEKEIGFDAATHLDGVTCYGNGGPDQRVIVIRHHFENEKLEAWLKTKNYETGKINDVVSAYFLPVKLEENVEGKILLVFPKKGVVLMGLQPESISEAIARLDDNATVAKIPDAYRQLSVAGSAFSGAVDVDACRGSNPCMVSALNSKVTAFAAGIAGSNIEGEVRSEMNSPEAAQAAINIIQGYCNSQAASMPFLKSVTSVSSGNKLQVKGTLPMDTLILKIRQQNADCGKAGTACQL